MKKKLGIATLVLAPLIAWLLWPLSAPHLHIVDDPQKLDGKSRYLAAAPLPPMATPPNVVLLLADDLGKTDISLYGSPHLETPHIDSIGLDGVTFDEGYISSPVCSPSRAGLMTGRYQQRFGFEILVHDRYAKNRLEWAVFKWFIARGGDFVLADRPLAPDPDDIILQGLPQSELTLAEVLKHAGYATAIMGKWHLGNFGHSTPTHRGFDYHYGFYDGYSFYADPKTPGIVNFKHDDFTERFIWENARKGNCALHRNADVIDDNAYLTTRLAEESVAFIEKNKARPFFLFVPFSAPHTPFQATQAYYDQFKDEPDPNKRIYYAMIKALDDSVGTILDALERNGLAENTVVWFLSDNGGATYTRATDNAPLRGGKLTNFEGGLNVPFMVRWPGHAAKGTHFAHPVSALDVFTTTLAATQTPLPADRPYDGVDLTPFLSGEASGPPHPELFWREMYARAVRKGSYKLVRDGKADKVALFDLAADRLEKTNLAAERPDVVRELDADFDAWERKMQNPLWPSIGDYVHHDFDGEWYFPL